MQVIWKQTIHRSCNLRQLGSVNFFSPSYPSPRQAKVKMFGFVRVHFCLSAECKSTHPSPQSSDQATSIWQAVGLLTELWECMKLFKSGGNFFVSSTSHPSQWRMAWKCSCQIQTLSITDWKFSVNQILSIAGRLTLHSSVGGQQLKSDSPLHCPYVSISL